MDPSVATTPLLWAKPWRVAGHRIKCKKLKLPLSPSGAFCNICFVTSQTQPCAQCLLRKALKSCHGRKKAVRAQKCFPPSSRHHVYDSRGCVVTAAGRRRLGPLAPAQHRQQQGTYQRQNQALKLPKLSLLLSGEEHGTILKPYFVGNSWLCLAELLCEPGLWQEGVCRN